MEGEVKKLRVGFVGCGGHATANLYPSLHFLYDKVDLVAVADLKEALARRNARLFGAGEWFTSHEEMLKKADVEAAIVVTPVNLHAPIVVDCLNAGLHVLVEKPMCDTLDNARLMVDAARRNERHLMVAFMKRFIPTYAKAKEVSDQPGFGKHFIQLKYCSGAYPTYFNHLLDYTVHHFDLARYYMGDVHTLYAVMAKPKAESNLASITVAFRFRNGSAGALHTGSAELWTQLNERVEIVGNSKFIIVDNYIDFKLFDDAVKPVDSQPLKPFALYWTPNYPIPSVPNQSYVLGGYVGELDHFVSSLLDGRKPSPDAVDGFKALQLVYKTDESIKTGDVVEVPDTL